MITSKRRTNMQKLEKANILIVRKPDYVKYTCPKCGEEIDVDYDDFSDDRMCNYWPEWEGDTVICYECGAEFQIDKVEVD